MKTDEDFNIKVLGACLGSIIAAMWLIFEDWHSFRGSYLVDKSSYQQLSGLIIESSAYTSKYKRKTMYHYKILYEFTIKGAKFYSDRVTFAGDESSSKEYAELFLSRYPKGKIVTVFYDPSDPTFSVLEPEVTDGGTTMLIVFVLLIIFFSAGSYLLIIKVRSIKEN